MWITIVYTNIHVRAILLLFHVLHFILLEDQGLKKPEENGMKTILSINFPILSVILSCALKFVYFRNFSFLENFINGSSWSLCVMKTWSKWISIESTRMQIIPSHSFILRCVFLSCFIINISLISWIWAIVLKKLYFFV